MAAAIQDFGDCRFEETTKKLGELMSELMTIKKMEKEDLVSKLHSSIQRRISALKKLQIETFEIDAEFHRDVLKLEQDFQLKHNQIFNKRLDIVAGEYEPSDEECKIEGEDAAESKNLSEVGGNAPRGIPDFWMTVLKNVTEFKSMIQESDEPILKHLTDVRVVNQTEPELSFSLDFYFSPNDYFKNQILTKTYLMKCKLDEHDVYGFEGPEIVKCIGCEILWNEGKDVTKVGVDEENMDTEAPESFFNFFSPPELLTENEEYQDAINEKIEDLISADFAMGHFIKERVIPRAVMYFVGEYSDVLSSVDSSSVNVHTYFASDDETVQPLKESDEDQESGDEEI